MCTVGKLSDLIDDCNPTYSTPKRTWEPIRRLIRILIMLVGAALTIYVCILSSERYFQYWVQTTIERTDVHVSEISFPAIAICPTQLSMDTNTRSLHDPRLVQLFNLVQSIGWHIPYPYTDFSEFKDFDNQTLVDIVQLMKTGYSCKELFAHCTWRRQEVDCCTVLFRPFNLGTCFVFNTLLSPTSDPTWPWSVADSGQKSALNIKLNRNIKGITLDTIGVIVLEPGEYVGSSVIYSSDDRIFVALHPIRFTADPAVKSRPVQMRHCYFPEELTQTYSECIVRCHLKYISRKCKCEYRFDLHNSEGRTTRSCRFSDLPCIKSNGVSLFYMSNIIEESSDFVFNITDCKCFPVCDHTQFHANTYTDHSNSVGTKNNVEVNIYFQEETLFSYRSTLHITMLDLMVSYGGIAGLFLGLSVLGAINSVLDRIGFCSKPKAEPVKPDPASDTDSRFFTCKENK